MASGQAYTGPTTGYGIMGRGFRGIAALFQRVQIPTSPEDPVTIKLLDDKIPTIGDVATFLGEGEILKAFYLSAALLDGRTRREDQAPYMVHPVSVAGKLDYRFNDPVMPSGVRLNTYSKVLGLVHELREIFGKDPLGSYIVGAIVSDFLGSEVARGLDYMTKRSDIVFGAVKPQLDKIRRENRWKYRDIEPAYVGERLQTKLDGLAVNPDDVKFKYVAVQRALRAFVYRITNYHPELGDADKKDIIGIIEGSFIGPLSAKIKAKDFVDPTGAARCIEGDFQHVLGIIKSGQYAQVNRNLIHTTESPGLVILNQTLYQDFLKRIMEDAYDRIIAHVEAEQAPQPSSLDVVATRLADSIAYAATLQDDMPHGLSQFRKIRRVDDSVVGLVKRLSDSNDVHPDVYAGIEKELDYLRRVLIWRLELLHKGAKDSNAGENIFGKKEQYLEAMIAELSRDEKSFKRGGSVTSLSLM